jgi:threonine/homoserine/homoserine lactone efflux protein
MPFLLFLSEAILISLSGVLAPGPITAISVSKGSKLPWAGSLVAIGHGIVEFPLMVLVFFGIGSVLNSVTLQVIIGIAGGLFVVWMGIGLLRETNPNIVQPGPDNYSPIISGVIFSIGNPYFLVWWGTVGAALILQSFAYGVIGFVAFALCHWFCDLGWNTLLSLISYKGRQFFGHKFQQGVFILSGILLLFTGGRLVFDAVLLVLPL